MGISRAKEDTSRDNNNDGREYDGDEDEFAPMEARELLGVKMENKDDDGYDDDGNAKEMGERKNSALDELNSDGYFGSRDGNWIEDNDEHPLVLRDPMTVMEAPTLREDMRELWKVSGRKIVISSLTVAILITCVAIASMKTSTRTTKPVDEYRKRSPWDGAEISPASLSFYWGYKWERIPSECVAPEAPYDTDWIGFDEDGVGVDILGRREDARINGEVGDIQQDEEDMFGGTTKSRRRALELVFSNSKRCPLETIQCGFSGATSAKPQSFGTCAIVGPAIYKGMNMGPKIDQHDTVIRLASMPNEDFKNDLGAKTSVIYATGEQSKKEGSYTPFGPINSKTQVREGWVPDKFWIVEDEKHQDGELEGVSAHNGKPVLWVNRPFPSATKRNYDSDLQAFDFRFFANRVLAAAHEKEDMSEAWFTPGADDDIPDTYKTQDHYALLFNVMFSGLCESIHTYGFGYRPLVHEGILDAEGIADVPKNAYYAENPATRAHFALLSDAWNTAKRDTLIAKILMTNNTICSFGAS